MELRVTNTICNENFLFYGYPCKPTENMMLQYLKNYGIGLFHTNYPASLKCLCIVCISFCTSCNLTMYRNWGNGIFIIVDYACLIFNSLEIEPSY